MGRPSNTGERRQQIVKAFVKVVAKQGYDGAPICDIAERAGLSQGLVHYHFKNKLEILLAALEWIIAEHQALLDERLASYGQGPSAELAAFIDVHLGATRLRAIIERGVKAKAFDCDEPGAAAAGLLSTIQGYFVVAGSARTVIPSGSAARSTISMAEGLLKPAKRLRLPK